MQVVIVFLHINKKILPPKTQNLIYVIVKKAQYKLGFRFTRVRTNWNSSGKFCSGVVNCRYAGKEGNCDIRNVNLTLLCKEYDWLDEKKYSPRSRYVY